MASIVGGPSGALVPGHARTGLECGRILATIWIPRGGKPIENCADLDRSAGMHAMLATVHDDAYSEYVDLKSMEQMRERVGRDARRDVT